MGYFARLYEDYVRLNELNIYSETRLKLPKPQYFVFYNGTKAEPDRQILKLSDSFPDDGIQPHLEVMVVALNINYGHNRELMEKCQSLHDYAVFVDTVKRYIDQGYITRRAVDMAVEECIANDILREFLVRNKTGVMRMLFGKEDWERHKQREMKALAEETVRRVTKETEKRVAEETEKRVAEETEKRVRKALEQQMAEEIERRVQQELERRTTIKIICDSLEKLGEVPEDLRRILEEQKNSAILRKWSELAAQVDSIEKFQSEMKNALWD